LGAAAFRPFLDFGCMGADMTDHAFAYRDFEGCYDPPPIPIRGFDWHATHKDYDPTPQYLYDPPADGDRLLWAPSRELLIAAIDAWHEENPS
jgi:hypothetical protein